MNCLRCGGEFESLRSTAKFCSTKCKLAYHRKDSPTVFSVSRTDDEVLSVSKEPPREPLSVSMDTPCDTVRMDRPHLDLEKDLGLNLKKDLGITSWTENGIMLRNDITVPQVRNIANLVRAKHGLLPKDFESEMNKPYVSGHLIG